MFGAQPPVRGDDCGLLAVMGRGGGDDRAHADGQFQLPQRCFVDRRRRRVELEIAGRGHTRRAQRAVALRVGGRLGEAEIEARQQRRDHARHHLPAAKRALREPAIDHDHRDLATPGLHDQVGPQIGFDEQRQVRPPMIEKAADITRRVERDELVQHARRQAVLGQRRRRHRARRDQDGKALGADALDQRQHRQHLADAGRVHPDQRTVRARLRRLPAALGEPRRMLLAALEPPRQ